jgi:hypothetical protein
MVRPALPLPRLRRAPTPAYARIASKIKEIKIEKQKKVHLFSAFAFNYFLRIKGRTHRAAPTLYVYRRAKYKFIDSK